MEPKLASTSHLEPATAGEDLSLSVEVKLEREPACTLRPESSVPDTLVKALREASLGVEQGIERSLCVPCSAVSIASSEESVHVSAVQQLARTRPVRGSCTYTAAASRAAVSSLLGQPTANLRTG